MGSLSCCGLVVVVIGLFCSSWLLFGCVLWLLVVRCCSLVIEMVIKLMVSKLIVSRVLFDSGRCCCVVSFGVLYLFGNGDRVLFLLVGVFVF